MNFNIRDKNGYVVKHGPFHSKYDIPVEQDDYAIDILDEAGDVVKTQLLTYHDESHQHNISICYILGNEMLVASNESVDVTITSSEGEKSTMIATSTPQPLYAHDGVNILSINNHEKTFEVKNDSNVMSAFFGTDELSPLRYFETLTDAVDKYDAVQKMNRILITQYENTGIRYMNNRIYLNNQDIAKCIVRDATTQRVICTLFDEGALPTGQNELCRVDAYDEKGDYLCSQFCVCFEQESLQTVLSNKKAWMNDYRLYIERNSYLYETEPEDVTQFNLLRGFHKERYEFAPPSLVEANDEGLLYDLGIDEEVIGELFTDLTLAVASIDQYDPNATYRMAIDKSEFTIEWTLIKMLGDPACYWIESDGNAITPIVFISEEVERMQTMAAYDSNTYITKYLPAIRQVETSDTIAMFNSFNGSEATTTYEIPYSFASLLVQHSYANEDALPASFFLLKEQFGYMSEDAFPNVFTLDRTLKRLIVDNDNTYLLHITAYNAENQNIESFVYDGISLLMRKYYLVIVTVYHRPSKTPVGLLVIQPNGKHIEYQAERCNVEVR